MSLDFNRAHLSDTRFNRVINAMIEAAEPAERNERQYLGASSVGSGCLRKIQYDWQVDARHDSRTRDISVAVISLRNCPANT